MRHYPHPYKPSRESGRLGSLVLLLLFGAVLVGSWRASTRPRRHSLGARGDLQASVGRLS